MSCNYDLIIVGGGIAGLRVGIETLRRRPHIRCCILEKYGYIGGRVVTFRKNIPKVGEVQWENGAGRIAASHKKVLQLLKEYRLSVAPLSPETLYIDDKTHNSKIPYIAGNDFNDLINYYITPIEGLSQDTLADETLGDILESILGADAAKNFYMQFPYYSEIHTLRADLAIKAFKGEMGAKEQFVVCREGLSSLVDGMKMEFISRGGSIIMDTELYAVKSNTDKTITLECNVRHTERNVTYCAKMAVLALHHTALKGITGIKQYYGLRYLTMTPLLRMYAVFPTKRGGGSWFSGMDKIVTNSPIRYIIPIDPKRGIVMISYTDGDDAKYWMKQDDEGGEENVRDLVMTEIRKLFPDIQIPDPVFFKMHQWHDGCTYWIPGCYNVEEESFKSLQPFPSSMHNLFICSESFAVKQCWIESALDQADKLLQHPSFRIGLRNI